MGKIGIWEIQDLGSAARVKVIESLLLPEKRIQERLIRAKLEEAGHKPTITEKATGSPPWFWLTVPGITSVELRRLLHHMDGVNTSFLDRASTRSRFGMRSS